MLCAKTEGPEICKTAFSFGPQSRAEVASRHPSALQTRNCKSAPKVIIIATVTTSACTDHNFLSEQGLYQSTVICSELIGQHPKKCASRLLHSVDDCSIDN